MSSRLAVASFFPTPALDHAFAGIGAGTVAVLCMQPLDLLKVKFQVATTSPTPGNLNPLRPIYQALRDIKRESGWRGLYRGVGANVAGNAASWGLYFWFYTIIKTRMTDEDPHGPLSSTQYLSASAQASAVTALMTNPIWVVKVRLFTTKPDSPNAYRGLLHGLSSVYKTEGIRGLYRGTAMALFGVSSGAVQFMAYEQMKNFAFERKRRKVEAAGGSWKPGEEKLSNTTYTVVSASAKLAALVGTYPYQVIRSRMQNSPSSTSSTASSSSSHALASSTNTVASTKYTMSTPNPPTASQSSMSSYPNLRTTIARTWAAEGYRGLYRGLGTNLVRVLPGTCITFVVYENLAWTMKQAGRNRFNKDL